MGLNPNTDNYTVPGGIALYFKETGGAVFKHLGNIVEVEMEPGAEELEHYSNLSGKRTLDKSIVLEEKLSINFTFDEANIENMRYFFRAGSIENVGEGTDNATDIKVTFDGTRLISVGDYYGISAVTVRQFLDYCYLYDDSLGDFVDNSAEADTSGGSAFEIMAETADYLYLGKTTMFGEVYFDLAVNGSYTGLDWEFWNGSAWTDFSPTGAGASLDADGKVVFGTLTGFAMTSVNGVSAYWVRVAASGVTTAATVNSIRQDGVQNTDWVLDPGQAGESGRESGRVGRLSAGFFEDGEEVKVTFTYTTWTSQKMALSYTASLEGEARLEVHPSAGRGHRFDLVFGRVSIKARGAMSLADNEWLKGPMTLEVLDNSTNDTDYPFGYYQAYGIAT